MLNKNEIEIMEAVMGNGEAPENSGQYLGKSCLCIKDVCGCPQAEFKLPFLCFKEVGCVN